MIIVDIHDKLTCTTEKLTLKPHPFCVIILSVTIYKPATRLQEDNKEQCLQHGLIQSRKPEAGLACETIN